MKRTVNLIAAITLISVGVSNAYAQKKLTPRSHRVLAAQIDQAQRLTILANAQKFVAQTGRWMRVANAGSAEALLAKQANTLLLNANPLDPTIVQLRELHSMAHQTQLEKETWDELENFVAQNKRFPREDIRPLQGKVEKLTPAQLAEYTLSQKIKLIEAKDPTSDTAQKIQGLRELWVK